ncbi:SEC-C motif domain protein [Sulfurimonas autotrophica DSM 16294]|uniref:SEC-C motif domain protein n=2 Tax=Sulfurimonas autotrophica TaxID=202747 RepID=E0UQ16_SULAO|nr:SEC-C motif domain protein [Sulfurimonas autotrophica DSM 16294]
MCICGNDLDFNECCGPVIEQKKAAQTPDELMRSRYSAYVLANGEYLVYSSAAQNRYMNDITLIEEFSNSVKWLGLNVLHVKIDSVEFKAYYRDNEGIKVLHEKSNFIKENGLWKYADGELYNSKIERNESCPCGSGKKYKKCCGK